MFGASPLIAENIEIKNGYFGLTSHHAIHGNRNKNIHIHDIDISNFETHGIQLNGFENIILSDIKIHDSSQIAYLKGEYGHGRMLLPRLKAVASSVDMDQFIEERRIELNDNEFDLDIDFDELYNELMSQLNMAFEYAIKFNKNSDDINDHNKYELWLKTRKNVLYKFDEDDDTNNDAVITNSNGLPYGTGVYGIFLSSPGANVFSMGNSKLRSNTAILKNIEISGIRHKMHEYLRTTFYVNPFNAILDASVIFDNLDDMLTSEYIGNILTDSYATMDYVSNNWGILQMANLNSGELSEYALQ